MIYTTTSLISMPKRGISIMLWIKKPKDLFHPDYLPT